jgi:hypothetical protein
MLSRLRSGTDQWPSPRGRARVVSDLGEACDTADRLPQWSLAGSGETWRGGGKFCRVPTGRSGAQPERRAQVGQDLLGVGGGVGDRIGPRHTALRIDQVGDAPRIGAALAALSGPVGCRDSPLGIREQGVGKVELGAEGLVGLGCVVGDPEDLRAELAECRGSITEPLTFLRSPGRVRLGIPPEDDPAPAEVGQRDGLAVVVVEREGRCGRACFEHLLYSLMPAQKPSPSGTMTLWKRASRCRRSLNSRIAPTSGSLGCSSSS